MLRRCLAWMRNRVSGDTWAMVWPHAGVAPHVTQRATCGAPDTRLLQLYTCRVALAASRAEKKLNMGIYLIYLSVVR